MVEMPPILGSSKTEICSTPAPQSIKAIIERDYTDLNVVRFFEACPIRIKPLVEPEIVINTVKKINEILAPLTQWGAKEILENFTSATSLYLANPLLPHGTKRCLQKLSEYIDQQNEVVYRPLGLKLINPVSMALLQLEFHFGALHIMSEVHESELQELQENLNTSSENVIITPEYAMKLLKFAWTPHDNSIVLKRTALEVVIQYYCEKKNSFPQEAINLISSYMYMIKLASRSIEKLGSSDFELRSLMLQLLFNLRKHSKLSGIMQKSIKFNGIYASSVSNFTKSMKRVLEIDIPTFELHDLYFSMKLYTCGIEDDKRVWISLNEKSFTTNVLDPITEQQILIEILYSSILDWSIQCEETIGTFLYINMDLVTGQKCRLGFKEMISANLAKSLIAEKTSLRQIRRISIVHCPSQNFNQNEDDLTEISSPPPLSSCIRNPENICEIKSDATSGQNLTPLTPKSNSKRVSEGTLITPPVTATNIPKHSKDLQVLQNSEMDEIGLIVERIIDRQNEAIEVQKLKILEKSKKKSRKLVSCLKLDLLLIKKSNLSTILRPQIRHPIIPDLLGKARRLRALHFEDLPKWDFGVDALFALTVNRQRK